MVEILNGVLCVIKNECHRGRSVHCSVIGRKQWLHLDYNLILIECSYVDEMLYFKRLYPSLSMEQYMGIGPDERY